MRLPRSDFVCRHPYFKSFAAAEIGFRLPRSEFHRFKFFPAAAELGFRLQRSEFHRFKSFPAAAERKPGDALAPPGTTEPPEHPEAPDFG